MERPRARTQCSKTEQGFTLLELVLALAILAVILSIIYAAYATSVEVMQTAQKRTENYQEVRIIFDLLAQQLSSAYLSTKDGRTLFLGEDDTSGDFPVDRLTFTAPTATLLPLGSGQGGGLCTIRYFVQNQTEESLVKSLFRQEVCPPVPVEGETIPGGITLELSNKVLGFDLKYYLPDGEEFERWDSRTPGETLLPVWVKVTLLLPLETPQGKLGERIFQPFSTAIEIPIAHQWSAR